MKTAIIKYDEKRIADWNGDAEAYSVFWILKEALNGRDYARERGIVSIEIESDDLIVIPRYKLADG